MYGDYVLDAFTGVVTFLPSDTVTWFAVVLHFNAAHLCSWAFNNASPK